MREKTEKPKPKPICIDLRNYPYAVARHIRRSSPSSDTFTGRIPFFMGMSLEPYLISFLTGLRNLNEEMIGPFLTILGQDLDMTDIPRWKFVKVPKYNALYTYPFDIWHNEAHDNNSNNEAYDPEFEAKVATQLINFLIQKISSSQLRETNNYNDDLSNLAGLLTALQIVSTNLLESPNYARDYLYKIKDFSNLEYIYLEGLRVYWDSFFENPGEERSLKTKEQVCRLYYNHILANLSGFESGFRVPKNLLGGFFSLLKKAHNQIHTQRGVYFTEDQLSLVDNIKGGNREYVYNGDKTIEFFIRYFFGLLKVAEAVLDGKHNGNLYLYDHIKRVMEKNHAWPENPDDLSTEKWEELLIKALDYKDGKDNRQLFDFLKPEEAVREVKGRYDYRALLEYFKEQEKKDLSVMSLGFGQLGVESHNLIEKLRNIGINVDFNGLDILPAEKIDENMANKYGITEYLRTEGGVLSDTDRDGIIDSIRINVDEVEKVIDWHNRLVGDGKLFGGIDLTREDALEEGNFQQYDLVTLQGTVGCIDDLAKRATMIKNALRLVNPNGGVLLLEGGMTFYGGQNVNSIALRLNNGKVEILYIEVARTKDLRSPVHYSPGNITLLGNSEFIKSTGENWISVPFSNQKQLIPALFNAINLKKE